MTRNGVARLVVAALAVAGVAIGAAPVANAAPTEFNLRWKAQLRNYSLDVCNDNGPWYSTGSYQFRLKPASGGQWAQLTTFLLHNTCSGNYYLQSFELDTHFYSTAVVAGANSVEFKDFGGGGLNVPSVSLASDVFLESAGFMAPRLVFSGNRLLAGRESLLSFFTLSLSAFDLVPGAAADLGNLQAQLDGLQAELGALAGRAEGAAAKLQRVRALQAELDALLGRGFANVTVEGLRELFARYVDVISPAVAEAITRLLDDFNQSLGGLVAEVGQAVDSFRTQMHGLDSTVSGPAEGHDFDLSNPGNYVDDESANNIPGVDIPQPPGDEFDPDNDPWKAYADEVIGRLQATFVAGEISDRGAFLDVVSGWTANHAALESLVLSRGGAAAGEYQAFQLAEHRVLTFVQQFLDATGWFIDNPVPPGIREFVDMGVAMYSLEKAKGLKRALNRWSGTLTPQQQAWADMLLLVQASWDEAKLVSDARDPQLRSTFRRLLDGVIQLAIIGVQFTPIGDVLAACELVSGWENCNPNGRTLSIRERAFAAAGLVIGSASVWRKAGELLGGARREASQALEAAYDEVRRIGPSVDNPNIRKIADLEGGGARYKHVEHGWEVDYDGRRQPDFEPYRRPEIDGKKSKVYIDNAMPPSRPEDFRRANIEAGFGDTPLAPDGWTWHHGPEYGEMLLVQSVVHDAFRHTGHFAFLKRLWDWMLEYGY
jgi:hypothetical protein